MDPTFDDFSVSLQALSRDDTRLEAIALEMQSLSAIWPGACCIDASHARVMLADPSCSGRLRYEIKLPVYTEDESPGSLGTIAGIESSGQAVVRILVSVRFRVFACMTVTLADAI